jgi:N-acetyl-anhydromuramyl-L-alanine amidase AmpD
MWRALLVSVFVLGSLAISATPAHAEPPSYYPALQWVPAAAGNYEVGRAGQQITAIVIHETDSSFSSALYTFRNPRSRTSSHYLVGAWDGAIAQTVAESDTAYHARSANRWTIGIEHEFWPRYGIWHTEAQYRSSARLVCAIAHRYGIPLDRAHIVGHNELPGNDHSDPGPSWNWSYYMSLVRACDTRAAQAVASTDLPTRPTAELVFGDVSADVALLQWGLAYLGHMPADEVVGGGWRFGTVTEVSLRQFQSARGLPATGRYGESSASALAQALEASPPDLPAKLLEVGAESDEVTRVQTVLQTLGYIDRSTGYFGPMTLDALARFQWEHGIDATGVYDAVTRIALAAALRSGVPQGSDLSAYADVKLVE